MKKILRKIKIRVYLSIEALLFFLGNRLISLGGKRSGFPVEYKKDKSIGLFVFDYNHKKYRRECKEIARGKISSQGDVYVFPDVQSQHKRSFHESFHKSGKYHWRNEKDKAIPAFEGKGLPASHKFIYFRARLMPCFCFRLGKRIKKEEIRPIVEKLIRYVPPVDIEEVVSELKKREIYQARLQNLNHHIKQWQDLLLK